MIWFLKKIWRKFRAAFEGIAFGLKNDESITLQMFLGALVIVFGIIYPFTMVEWIVVILLILLVVAFEFMNSAIEEIVDMISPHYSEKAKIIKDYAAAAVLLMAFAALVIGLAILKGVLR